MKHARTALWSRLAWGVMVGGSLAGCSSAATPPPAAASGPAQGDETATGLAPVKLTPVEAPTDLLALARARSLPTALDAVVLWAGVPFDWRSELENSAPGVLDAVDLDAPVEFAATLDPTATNAPRVFAAFSLPLKSREAALALAEARGFATDVLDEATHEVDMGKPCYISASLGAAPARLVCSPKRDALEALNGFMTRGLPTMELPNSTLFATIKAEPFRRRYAEKALVLKSLGVPFLLREARLDQPTFDSALSDAAHAVADDAIGLLRSDLDALTLSFDVDESAENLDLVLHFALQDEQTWVGHVLADLAAHPTAAPALLWQAPEGTDASYGSLLHGELTREMDATLARLLQGAFEYAGVSDKGRGVVRATQQWYTVTGPTVHVAKSREHGGPDVGSLPNDYQLVNVQGDGEGVSVTWLDEMLGMLGDPAVQNALKTRLDLPELSIEVKRKKGQIAGLAGTVFTCRVSGVGKLQQGDQPLEVTIFTAHEGTQSWFGVAQTTEQLDAGLSAWRQGAAVPREGLDSLRQGSAGGGFFSPRSLLGSLLAEMEREHPGVRDAALAAMPHGGRIPIPFRIVASQPGPRASAQLRVPKAAVTDLAQALLAVMAGR